jgi:hypothetical protein
MGILTLLWAAMLLALAWLMGMFVFWDPGWVETLTPRDRSVALIAAIVLGYVFATVES